MNVINEFSGEYSWLSNFILVPIILDDVRYPSVENAYQASKTLDISKRKSFEKCSPSRAKYLGHKLRLRQDWNIVKIAIMRNFLCQKFEYIIFRELLLETGNIELIEGNTWNDTFWGKVNGVGTNHLGKLLMDVRKELYIYHR